MNPTTPKAHRITPDCQPVFPCWLWKAHPLLTKEPLWLRCMTAPLGFTDYRDIRDAFGATHWHEDQPTAPTSIPSPVSSQDSEGTGWAIDVTVADGKYTVRQSTHGNLWALRYGEPWQELTGNNLVLALAQEVDRLRSLRPNQPAQEAAERAAKSVPCPHCGDALLWSEDRGAHCDGCDDFDPETDLPEVPAPSPGASGEVFFAYFAGANEDRKACWTVQHGPGFIAEFHNYKGEADHATAGAWARKVAVLLQADAQLAAPPLPGGTLVDGKDGENIPTKLDAALDAVRRDET